MNILDHYEKKNDYLVCVDSDGCAMDTMDIKHYSCFGPCMTDEWDLNEWRDEILTRWNEINLYTITRGVNRFKGLALMLTEVDKTYKKIEDLESLVRWTEETKELSNGALAEAIAKSDSICLKKALSWSKAVNDAITALPEEEKKPFPGAKEALAAAKRAADVAIVSSANQQAVEEEWSVHGLLPYTDILLSQNAGSKAYCIGRLLEYGYEKDKTVMVGDAQGDADAASKNGVLFYPILVRKEKESWDRFAAEALDRLKTDRYRGEYQDMLMKEFYTNLGK